MWAHLSKPVHFWNIELWLMCSLSTNNDKHTSTIHTTESEHRKVPSPPQTFHTVSSHPCSLLSHIFPSWGFKMLSQTGMSFFFGHRQLDRRFWEETPHYSCSSTLPFVSIVSPTLFSFPTDLSNAFFVTYWASFFEIGILVGFQPKYLEHKIEPRLKAFPVEFVFGISYGQS